MAGWQKIISSKPLRIIAVLLALGLAAWGASLWIWPYVTYRDKITVEIETPQGLKTASIVREHTFRVLPPDPWYKQTYHVWGKCEARLHDLGGGKNLVIGCINAPNGNTSGGSWFLSKVFGLARFPVAASDVPPVGTRVEVGAAWLPRILTLKDIRDPKSFIDILIQANPPQDNFSEVFGLGYRFEKAWVEITNEPVIVGEIEKVLPFARKAPRNPQSRKQGNLVIDTRVDQIFLFGKEKYPENE